MRGNELLIAAPDRLVVAAWQQLFNDRHTEGLLECADHHKACQMRPPVFFLDRGRDQLHFYIVIDHGGGNELFIIAFIYKITEVPVEHHDHLIHI